MKRSKQYAKYALLLLLIPIAIVLFFMDQVGLVKLYRQNHTEKQDMVYNAVSLYEKQIERERKMEKRKVQKIYNYTPVLLHLWMQIMGVFYIRKMEQKEFPWPVPLK